MKLLIFSAQRKIIRFTIDKRKIIYFDEVWKNGIQIYPLDKLLVKRMTISRKPTVSAMGLLIIEANQGKNLEEYESCKSEESLADMIRKEALSKGLVEVVK